MTSTDTTKKPLMIENAAIDKHMVACMSGRRLDPDGLNARPTPTLQESVSEDMACATREEDTVWEGPSHLGVALAIAWGPGLIHEMPSVGASIESIDPKVYPFGLRLY